MPSVATCFENMLRNVTPTDDETEQAIRSHRYMRRRLEHRPWILGTFLTGSYKRKTAIHPLHDVDVFCVVHPDWAEHYHDCPVGIQHEVRLALRQIYPRTSILLQTHSLGVDFRTQRIGYDVIPAVPTEDPGYFQIVRKDPLCWTTGGTFILSCPAATEVEKKEANRLGGPGGRMLKLIRLMKHWNCKNNKMLKSFHLELMCYKAASELRSCMNDREACELLFQFLAYAVLEDCFVPGKYQYNYRSSHYTMRQTDIKMTALIADTHGNAYSC